MGVLNISEIRDPATLVALQQTQSRVPCKASCLSLKALDNWLKAK